MALAATSSSSTTKRRRGRCMASTRAAGRRPVSRSTTLPSRASRDAAARHLLGDGPGRRRRVGRDARSSAPSRSRSSWRRRFTTPRTAFPLSESIAAGWANSVKMHSAHPNSRKTYLIDGERAPKAGEVFRNPDLAGSLRLIAEKGRDGYYKGKTAEAILTISREQGGTMTAADLAEFQPEWVTPIKTSYRGWNVYEIGPQHAGHLRADDAEPDGAVPARRVRLPQHQRAARDDRGQEARLRRHAALRRRSQVLAQPGRRAAEQAARDRTGEADRPAKAACQVEPASFPASPTRRATTPSTCR